MDISSTLNVAAVFETSPIAVSCGKFTSGIEISTFSVYLGMVFQGTETSTSEGFYGIDTTTFSVSSGTFFSTRDFYL